MINIVQNIISLSASLHFHALSRSLSLSLLTVKQIVVDLMCSCLHFRSHANGLNLFHAVWRTAWENECSFAAFHFTIAFFYTFAISPVSFDYIETEAHVTHFVFSLTSKLARFHSISQFLLGVQNIYTRLSSLWCVFLFYLQINRKSPVSEPMPAMLLAVKSTAFKIEPKRKLQKPFAIGLCNIRNDSLLHQCMSWLSPAKSAKRTKTTLWLSVNE